MMETGNSIEKRPLGKTDILVTPVGMGMMQFSGQGAYRFFMPVIPQEEKNQIVRAALEGGVNWFDTAEIYGLGVSERSLAAALKAAGRRNGDVVVATKWFPLFRTAGDIRRSIDVRLRMLDGYDISLYMVHQPWSFSSPEAEMDAMADLVEAGKIRAVGVSNFSAERMRRAHARLAKRGLPLAVNQVHYSLLCREIERNGVLDAARELGVTIIAYTPLEYGLLSGKYHRSPELLRQKPFFRRRMLERNLERSRPLIAAMEEMSARYNATLSQIALNWLVYFHGQMVVTIPGAMTARQAAENAGALRFHLSDEDLNRLDEQSRNLSLD
jgi:aryl-alcohol dehydrogenase-like predicted oxidoreductase